MSKGRIFISYRRQDSAGYAGRIYDRLAREFGSDQVFMDVDQIAPGEDFIDVINRSLSTCDIFIGLIGNRWLNIKDAQGNRRLDDPDDFVRLEFAAALKRDVRFIPVLVHEASMPTADELPPDLVEMTRRNALEIRHPHFNKDVVELISAVKNGLDAAQRKRAQARRDQLKKSAIDNLSWWQKLPLWGRILSSVAAALLVILIGIWIFSKFRPEESVFPTVTPSITAIFTAMVSPIPSPTPDLTRAALEDAIHSLQTQIALNQQNSTPTPNPLFGTITAVIEETQRAAATITATPSATLVPTEDPRTATIQSMQTEVALGQTEEAANETSTPSPTPSRTPTVTPTPTPTVTPVYSGPPFIPQEGNPIYLENIVHPDLGCSWMGISGQILDQNGDPLTSLVVQIGGLADTVNQSAYSLAGSAIQYGPGGFEVQLSDEPFDSIRKFYLELYTEDGQRVSNKIYFDTYADCNRNLILLNLVQVGEIPLPLGALQGKGMFIWKLINAEDGDPNAIADAAANAGFRFVAFKIADGVNAYDQTSSDGRNLIPLVINALRAKGIQAWGWHTIYGDDPRAEAKIVTQLLKDYDLDGYIVVVESRYEETSKAEAATEFMGLVRKSDPDISIGLNSSSFPSDHPFIPWNEFLAESDYVLPQAYWLNSDPSEFLEKLIKDYSDITDLPIIPIGAASVATNWAPTVEDVGEFMATADEIGLQGFGFWEWSDARKLEGIWDVIADYRVK